MKAEYVNPFIKGTEDIFKNVAGIDLKLNSTGIRKDGVYGKEVVVLIGLTGQLKGNIGFSMDKNMAMDIACKMTYGMPIATFDELAQSAVRELTNMLMGRVATLLDEVGKFVDITPPTLMTGDNLKVSQQVSPTLVIGFKEPVTGQLIDVDVSICEVA